MAAGPKKAKRRSAPITGRRSASTKPVRPTTEVNPLRRYKSQARSNAPTKEPAQKPVRGRRAAEGLRGTGRTDSVLAAQLEAIAHGLDQIADIRAEMEEMRTIIEELARNVAALVGNRSVQGRGPEPASTVTGEVLIVENYQDAGDEGPEPSGSAQD